MNQRITISVNLAIRWGCLFQNSPKNLDPSFKMDLELWECFRRENNHKNLDLSYKMTLGLWLHCLTSQTKEKN